MSDFAPLLLGAPFVWFLGWAVTRHKLWAWLPAVSTLASLVGGGKPLGVWMGQTPALRHPLSLTASRVVVGLALYLASRSPSFPLLLGVATLLIPLIFVVTFYVGADLLVGSIG
ncbi:hypothetical protein ACINK0_10290 [Deinococcus sp. VB343]|uniref:hypothetical protein n=1 Tax=Deinococcus sp. VB343 TaxID=3385567 RepID=UPI0039C8DA02